MILAYDGTASERAGSDPRFLKASRKWPSPFPLTAHAFGAAAYSRRSFDFDFRDGREKAWDLRTIWLADSRFRLGDFDESILCEAMDIPQTFLIPGVLFPMADSGGIVVK